MSEPELLGFLERLSKDTIPDSNPSSALEALQMDAFGPEQNDKVRAGYFYARANQGQQLDSLLKMLVPMAISDLRELPEIWQMLVQEFPDGGDLENISLYCGELVASFAMGRLGAGVSP